MIKKLKRLYNLSLSVVVGILFATLNLSSASAASAGSAYFTLSPASGTAQTGSTFVLTVSETSTGEDTNAAQVNLSYPTAILTFKSINLIGPFTICAQQTGGAGSVKIACASPTAEDGTKLIADVTFQVVATGSAAIRMTTGTEIANTHGDDVWNGILPSATYSFSNITASSSSTQATIPPELGSLSITVSGTKAQRLDGAIVTLDNSRTAKTDSSGLANFSGVIGGSHTLSITANGYKKYTTTVSLGSGANQIEKYTLAASPTSTWLIVLIIVAILVVLFLLRVMWKLKRKKTNKANRSA